MSHQKLDWFGVVPGRAIMTKDANETFVPPALMFSHFGINLDDTAALADFYTRAHDAGRLETTRAG